MQTRRTFICAVGGIFGAALLPTWQVPKPPIDLSPFCDDYSTRYDIRTPFAQGELTYATDARVIVRIDGTAGADKQSERRRPNAAGLWWRHDSVAKWQRWPRRRLVARKYCACPECGDRKPLGAGDECPECEGDGESCGIRCPQCHGRRWLGVFDPCWLCGGNWDDAKPSVMEVGGLQIAGYYDRIVRELSGVMFSRLNVLPREESARTGKPTDVILFRFDGGDGILCPMWEEP